MGATKCNTCANYRIDRDIAVGTRCVANGEYEAWLNGKSRELSDASTPFRMVVGGPCGEKFALYKPRVA